MEISVKNFYQLKNSPQNKDLDINTISFILDSFDNNDNKKSKKFSLYKKNNNIQKNNKVKNVKDKIAGKVKLILNKLSQNNVDSLVLEFVKNIKINTNEEYNEFLKTIYAKMLLEINFVKVYLTFLKYIACTYNKLLNYDISYFIELIENKFMADYFNGNNDEIFEDTTEDIRVNNLKLIREMIAMDFFDNNIEHHISNKILLQNNYLSDIYFWFKDTQIESSIITSIKNILSTNHEIEVRDKILLQNLIAPYETEPVKKSKLVFKKKKTTLTFEESVVELLNDYLVNDNYIIIKSFVESECKEINDKNKFSEIMINTYLTNNYKCVLELIEELINNQVLFKSNISKGLINLYNNDPTINKNNKNEMELVNKLKILGITKNLEFIMDKYKQEISI